MAGERPHHILPVSFIVRRPAVCIERPADFLPRLMKVLIELAAGLLRFRLYILRGFLGVVPGLFGRLARLLTRAGVFRRRTANQRESQYDESCELHALVLAIHAPISYRIIAPAPTTIASSANAATILGSPTFLRN